MAEPTVNIYVETAGGTTGYVIDDVNPNWTAITFGTSIMWITGPDTTTSALDPVTLPASSTKLAEEIWFDITGAVPAVYAQCPNYGTNTRQYELVVTFEDEACSARPRLEAWDSLTDLESLTEPENEILVGTTGTSSKSFLRAYDSTSAAPGTSTWYDSATQAADANNNKCLKGNQSYLVAQADKAANSTWYLKLACVVPYDAGIGVVSHDFVLVVRYFWV